VCAAAPEVADRYFLAGGRGGESFEAATARTMCTRCPVLTACLADAIARPLPESSRTGVIRGGHTAWAIAAFAAEAARERTSPHMIALREAGYLLAPLRGAYGSPRLRAGEFVSPEPLA
jgi:hypothetical protein